MPISTPFYIVSSIGFLGRFILALIILSVAYSKNKTDSRFKQGFIWLLCLGGLVLLIKMISIFSLFLFNSPGILSRIFSNYYWYF